MSLLGALHGVPTAMLTNAKVLVLGAGDGSSLFPLATIWPDATWVAVEPIAAKAEKIAEATVRLRIQNVTSVCATYAALDLTGDPVMALGPFDFIIVHGVLSRVDEGERAAVWRVLERALAPNGVALVSFDSWPGQHLFEPLRRLMAFHTAELTSDAERVSQARSIAKWHVKRWSVIHGTGRNAMLQRQLAELDSLSDEALLAELLAPENHSFYFIDVEAEATRHGLQWLTNARATEPRLGRMSSAVKTMLAEIPHAGRQQQYMDFLLHTRHRTSLFCRNSIELRRQVQGIAFADLFIAPRPGVELEARASAESRWLVEHVLSKLDSTVPVASVVDRAMELGGPPSRVAVLGVVAELFFADAVELGRAPPPILRKLPASDTYPLTTDWALAQARGNAPSATSVWQRELPLDALTRAVLARCDGSRAADELVEAIGPDAGDALELLHRHGFFIAPPPELDAGT